MLIERLAKELNVSEKDVITALNIELKKKYGKEIIPVYSQKILMEGD